MALTDEQRKVVEFLRNAEKLTIIADKPGYTVTIKPTGKTVMHEIAIAVQNFYNQNNGLQAGNNSHENRWPRLI